MSSVPWPTAALSSPANLEIVPIGRAHLAGFHAALDSVAKERRYLADARGAVVHAHAPVRARQPEGGRGARGRGGRWRGDWLVRPATENRPTLRHSAVLGMGIVAAYRGQGIGSRMLAPR